MVDWIRRDPICDVLSEDIEEERRYQPIGDVRPEESGGISTDYTPRALRQMKPIKIEVIKEAQYGEGYPPEQIGFVESFEKFVGGIPSE